MTRQLASDPSSLSSRESNLRWALRQIEETLRTLRFGSITLHVQDGVVVQVEQVAKTRYQRGDEASVSTP